MNDKMSRVLYWAEATPTCSVIYGIHWIKFSQNLKQKEQIIILTTAINMDDIISIFFIERKHGEMTKNKLQKKFHFFTIS